MLISRKIKSIINAKKTVIEVDLLKPTVNKMYELEHLVNTGGDKKRIDKLRNELGFERKQGRKINFEVDEYYKLKAQGLSDREVAKLKQFSYNTLWKWKNRNGLTAKSKVE